MRFSFRDAPNLVLTGELLEVTLVFLSARGRMTSSWQTDSRHLLVNTSDSCVGNSQFISSSAKSFNSPFLPIADPPFEPQHVVLTMPTGLSVYFYAM